MLNGCGWVTCFVFISNLLENLLLLFVVVTVNSDDGLIYSFLMHFFIRYTVPGKNELTCKEGPYVYQEWLGEDIVQPWEEVKRCIAKNGCKPGLIQRYRKSRNFRSGKNPIYKIFENHVNCTN